MSFRTLKARPKPNLDLSNKRRALTDEKINEEIQSKTESSLAENSEIGTVLAVSVNETNCNNNEEKSCSSSTSSSSSNVEVTTSSTKSSTISLAKLKPRPRPNLALGSRPNSATVCQRSSNNPQQDPEDCVIVSVSYTDNDVSQENKATSSNAAAVPVDAVKLSSDIQPKKPAKLKTRPIPNLIPFKRLKRPLPTESTPIAADSSNFSQHVNAIKHSKSDSYPTVTTPSKESTKECVELEKASTIEDNPTININSIVAKQENRKIVQKSQKKQVKLNARQLTLRGKLRSLVTALEFLEKIIAKKRKQINLRKLSKEVINSSNVSRKNVVITKKTNHTMKIIKMIKQKLKRSVMRCKMKDGPQFSNMLKIVMKEIKKAKKNMTEAKRKRKKNSISAIDEKKISLKKEKPTAIQMNKSHINTEDEGQRNECISVSNKDNSDSKASTDLKKEMNIVSAEKTNKVQKIRCKINPMITKPSGVKSMRIKLFKDDGRCENKSSDISSDKANVTTSRQTIKESSSPSKDMKSPANHSRRFNMNTVKPNLATANRNFKPIQYSTSYGKLNNAVKQKFRDKFGSKKPPEHSKLTMLDLIFYNPSSNPMSEKEKKKELSSESEISNDDSKQTIINEEKPVNEDKETTEEASEEGEKEASRAVDTNGLPVPQLKITADGKVIIAPESLIIAGKNDESINNESRPLIVENDLTHHKVFKKKSKLEKKIWTFQETLKFYKILNETGSDFLSMASHFPDRTRNSLKRKFKREEKLNGQLIDKVIGSRRIDFSHVEKELALNQMWDEVEKSCKRRSKFMPEIPDVNKGSISDMFLTKKERAMKATNGDDANAAENDHNSNKQIKQDPVKPRKTAGMKKKKPKVLRLKEYLSDNNNGSSANDGNTKKTFQINLKCLDEPESTTVSSDEEEIVKENTTSVPIVVNTSIESSGIKYTKSVTFNPGNMELPVDINETIAHTNEQEYPSSTEIIKEIVDILSTDERSSTTSEDVSESVQNICSESGNVCEESIIINDKSDNQ